MIKNDYSSADCAGWLSDPGFARFIEERDAADAAAETHTREAEAANPQGGAPCQG